MTSPDPGPSSEPDPAGLPSRQVLARRVCGFVEAVENRMATDRRRLPFGVGRFSRDLSEVYSLQTVQIERPVAAAELQPWVERLFGDLPNANLWTHVSEVAWALGPSLVERGWTPSRVVYMVHDPRTPPTVSPLGFEVVDAEGYADYDQQRVAEETWGTPAVAEQMQRRNQRLESRIGAEFLLSADHDAGCHLYRYGTIGQIEEVGVLMEARGRGGGAGLMAAALTHLADAETVFLIADLDDWPREWYARLGFVEVATAWAWDRRRDGAGPDD